MRASRLTSAALLALSLVAVALPAAADPEAGGTSAPTDFLTEDEAAERSTTRSRRTEVEGELELLRRSDVELRAEANRLEEEIAALDRRTAATSRQLEVLEADLDRLRREQVEVNERLERQRALVADRAVAAYIQPSLDNVAVVFAASEFHEVDRRFALLNSVAAADRQLIEGQRRLGEDLRRSADEVVEAEAALRDARAGQEADLAALQERRARQVDVRAALEVRIEAFQQEADALAADEAQLAALISQRRAAATTTTTTTAPATTTSTAPTTTAPPPGATPPGAPAPTNPPTNPPTTSAPPPTSPPTTAPSGGGMAWPTAGPVTSPYGFRWGRLHQGIDIGAPPGQPIVAAAGGTVFFAGTMGGYGLLTLIDHHDGRVTAYAHQTSFAVTGGSVSRGQVIGYVGSTGFSTGPHLHFEVRVNGVAVDPMPYLR